MSKLARFLVALSKKGTPIRHARGVVVSSTTGQTVVTIDGGSTNVTAYNYAHVQSLVAGSIVDLLLVGNKAYVMGYYASGWINASSFTNTWTAGGAGNTPRYLRVGPVVYLNGIVTGGTLGQPAFTLPSNYRPSQTQRFGNSANAVAGVLVIATTGGVTPFTGSTTSVSIDCQFTVI